MQKGVFTLDNRSLRNMSDKYCGCFYKVMVADNLSETWATVIEFVISLIISMIGIILNLKFWKLLQKERRCRPLGRKGNVIEPIMRWFGILQILYWPFELGFLWMSTNSIISHEDMPSWLCVVLSNVLFAGRLIIAFNSFFVALIRYIYIVHQQKANQWNFEMVGRCFQLLSIAVPLLVKTIEAFCLNPNLIISRNILEECKVSPKNVVTEEAFTVATIQWSLQYFPKALTEILAKICLIIEFIIYFNIIELILYIKIFGSIKR